MGANSYVFDSGIFLHLTATAQGVRPETVASGLQSPWAMAFLPDGRFLVAERPGRLRVVDPSGKVGKAVEGLPQMASAGKAACSTFCLTRIFPVTACFIFAFPSLPTWVMQTALRWRARF